MRPRGWERPAEGEYAPFYAGYIARVPDGDLFATLARQQRETADFLATIPESRGGHAYAPGKWSVKDVLGHLADAERVFGYRAMRIARADPTPLPGFDEQAWVPQAQAGRRTLADLAAELSAVRGATLALLRGLPAEAPTRSGLANNNAVSVRALAWIIAGHELHHLAILRERYLDGQRSAVSGERAAPGRER